ncbi:MAG: T9SS type A sorting domain-containing protein, partial [Ferruginibacter sp.]
MSTGSSGISGTITSCNSVLGSVTGSLMVAAYNSVYEYLIVGIRLENVVVIYQPTPIALTVHLDDIIFDIGDTILAPVVTSNGCRIAGSVRPVSPNALSGTLNMKTWIEPSVPMIGSKTFVARHHEITPFTNPTTSRAKITLYYTQQEFIDFNNHPNTGLHLPVDNADVIGKANLRISKNAGSSSDGSGLPASYPGSETTINPDDNDIIYNSALGRWEVSFDVTGFSGFFVHTNTHLLAVTLLSFSAEIAGNDGLLHWSTKDEIDLQSFDIERSLDGRNYSVIKNVTAYNQSGPHQYSYKDNNITSLNTGVVYYRLKQKNINGNFTYSTIVVILLNNKKGVLIYPNPVVNEINFSIDVTNSQQLRSRIIDYCGRIVLEQNLSISSGRSTHVIDVKKLSKGIYYLEVKSEGVNERRQFVKL